MRHFFTHQVPRLVPLPHSLVTPRPPPSPSRLVQVSSGIQFRAVCLLKLLAWRDEGGHQLRFPVYPSGIPSCSGGWAQGHRTPELARLRCRSL